MEMTPTSTPEAAFQCVIEAPSVGCMYLSFCLDGFERQSAIFAEVVLDCIRATQPMTLAKLEALHGEMHRNYPGITGEPNR